MSSSKKFGSKIEKILPSAMVTPFRRKTSVPQTQSLESVYTLKEALGKGTTCTVRRCVHKVTKEELAVKCIDLNVLSAEQRKRCFNEVDILKQCEHRNIIQLHEVYTTGNKLYLVLDLMSGGDLFDRIVNKSQFTEKDAAKVMGKVVMAIEFLHNKGIVHRDLKPENLLYFGSTDDSEIKIADFGLSKVNFNPSITNSPCGTPGWCAPEILKLQHYGKAIDMWSIGVILYTMLCGYPPFDLTVSTPRLHEKVMRGDFDFPDPEWSKISPEAKDLVQHLLSMDARKRFTASETLKHPWLSEKFKYSSNPLLSPKRLKEAQKTKSIDVSAAVQRMHLSEPGASRAAGSKTAARPVGGPVGSSGTAKARPKGVDSIFSYK